MPYSYSIIENYLRKDHIVVSTTFITRCREQVIFSYPVMHWRSFNNTCYNREFSVLRTCKKKRSFILCIIWPLDHCHKSINSHSVKVPNGQILSLKRTHNITVTWLQRIVQQRLHTVIYKYIEDKRATLLYHGHLRLFNNSNDVLFHYCLMLDMTFIT